MALARWLVRLTSGPQSRKPIEFKTSQSHPIEVRRVGPTVVERKW